MAYDVITETERMSTPHIQKVVKYLLKLPKHISFVIVHEGHIFPKGNDTLALILSRLNFTEQAKVYEHFSTKGNYLKNESELWKKVATKLKQ